MSDQIFFDIGGRGLAVYDGPQAGATLEQIVRHMRSVRDPVAVPDPEPPAGLPSDEIFYLTDHTAGVAEKTITDTQIQDNWTLSAVKTDSTSHITHEVTVTSITSATRAATLRFRIPVSRTGLSWLYKDLKTRLAVDTTSTYVNEIQDGYQVMLGPNFYARPDYLWAGVTNATLGYAVAVDPLVPVCFRTWYAAATQELCVAFYLGFHTDRRYATIKFHTWGFDPAVGARQIVSDLQNTICPTAYNDNLQPRGVRHGIWLGARNWETAPTINNISDFNITSARWGSRVYDYNMIVSLGLLPNRYSRPSESFIADMDPYPKPYTNTSFLAKLAANVAAGVTESLAIQNTAVKDLNGNMGWWQGDSYNDIRVVCNAAPGVQPTPNQYTEQWIPGYTFPLQDKSAWIDNSECQFWKEVWHGNTTRLNYDRSHIKYMQTNLAHDTQYNVGISYEMQQYEFLEAAQDSIVAAGNVPFYLWGNSLPYTTTFLASQFDGIGGENIWFQEDGSLSHPDEYFMLKRRIQAGKRVVHIMLCPRTFGEFPSTSTETYFSICCAFGVQGAIWHDGGTYTGGGTTETLYYFDETWLFERDRAIWQKYTPILRDISEAGWQPARNFTMSDSSIWGERFGDIAGTNKTVYLTCYNPATSSKTFTLTSSAYSSGVASFTELISNTAKTWSGTNLSVTLAARRANVFRIVLT